jgi:ATP synthase F1 complex assembly factor 2
MVDEEKAKKKKNVTASAADRRLAGRRRFYAHVGIAPISPPSPSSSVPSFSNKEVLESPISAGVDGTQSASGVNTSISDSNLWTSMLVPRRPAASSNVDEDGCGGGWYTITLDGRSMRTPLGLPLSLPSLPLAIAIASEWDAQRTHLRPAQMPLMTLCCTAIDQVAPHPESHRTDVLRYLRNDTTCYWADPDNVGDRALYRRQSTAWDGLHESTISGALGLPAGHDVRPAVARGEMEALSLGRRTPSNPTSGLPHPPLLVARASRWVDSLDAWTLASLYSAVAESKSFFVGAALVHEAMGRAGKTAAAAGGRGGGDGDVALKSLTKDDNVVRDGRWAVGAARIEEEFNIECWGLVEGGHDYDRLNCSIQIHAASFLARTVANR